MRSTGMHKTEPDIVTQVRRRLIRRYFHGIGAHISETRGVLFSVIIIPWLPCEVVNGF